MTTQTVKNDCFNSFRTFRVGDRSFGYYSLVALDEQGLMHLDRLPYSIRILLEAVLRNVDGFEVTKDDVTSLAHWSSSQTATPAEIPLKPARVILQDFTGVPAVVDLAAMRSAMKRLGGDPRKINPLIPVDLVIDHSVQTDFFGTNDALTKNVDLEFKRNRERYSVLHWAQQSLDNFRAVPPSVGIIHQVNLEFLARVVMQGASPVTHVDAVLYPDSVVGTDSHTVMINSLGVLGWGVGGIEAEAVMLGQPYYMLAPQVIGMELTGQPAPGVTATDIVLTLTELLRQEGVVGKFVEFFGQGVQTLAVADRAVLANMAPEYGATMGFFPTDRQTLEYLRQTGRSDDDITIIERYTKSQRMFFSPDFPLPEYTKRLVLDLSQVEPSLAGPKRPQDRVSVGNLKNAFRQSLQAPLNKRGFALSDEEVTKTASVDGTPMGQGAVVIASITSCTNTSNPGLMIAAGLLARNALARGLKVKPYVKTSLGPGSRVVTDYLQKANLLKPLESLGFNVVGYGCLTCIGNSGPLPEPVAKAIVDNDLVVSAVLSGNRNFEGRVNPLVKANYLASPPLVVAYAIAGTTDIDLTTQPLGTDDQG
ncbi:MAG: aconitate hydratase AcnA, partial [Planctomycetia bacterium]|nr:aconitate hydratase AcnA [Planctomycetia bacterium]